MIPTSSNYPTVFDTDLNLFLVHDSLRMQLVEDYNPGNATITVDGDPAVLANFSPTGLITLTEQCSDPALRALSFFYNGIAALGTNINEYGGPYTFNNLELLPGFTDCFKPKNVTDVTQNVMAPHHNALKDALIAIEEFIGVKCANNTRPLGATIEGRTNFIRNLALAPKAWFSVDKTVGLVPLTVTITDLSFGLAGDPNMECKTAPNTIIWTWDLGDAISQISYIVNSTIISNVSGPTISNINTPPFQKTYTTPGIYDLILTVTNDFGTDTCVLPAAVNARVPAPDVAVVEINASSGQVVTQGIPAGGPFTTPPKIRAPINTLIGLDVPPGINSNTGRSYAGELLDGNNNPIDPVVAYTWSLTDDLAHTNSSSTTAAYSVGGIYDLVLRADTRFGAYRITEYAGSFDIIENVNLWLWNFTATNVVHAYEMGLISETFKTQSASGYTIQRDSSFLATEPNSAQQIQEFDRNMGFCQRGTLPSGSQGTGLLFWATGRTALQSPSSEQIGFVEYNGFSDIYLTRPFLNRPWNWCSLSSLNSIYFLFGGITGMIAPYTSPTNQSMTTVSLLDLSTVNQTLTSANYLNGADELEQNVSVYDNSGDSVYGNFSVYRTTWQNSAGFIVRNDGVGTFFRLKSFYRTNGTSLLPISTISKLPDMPGPTKLEGQLVPLSSGVFFFNNSGAVSAYNPITAVWETGGPGVNSAVFRLLQDSSVTGFDNQSQTLLAASDGNTRAYLSFDYSSNAFIKFDEADLTFTNIGPRPTGNQWQLTIF